MINTSIGPLINRKIKPQNMYKRPMPSSNVGGMYPQMPMMNQFGQPQSQSVFDRNKMPMQNMSLQPGPVGLPKPKDVMPPQPTSGMKMDPSQLQMKQNMPTGGPPISSTGVSNVSSPAQPSSNTKNNVILDKEFSKPSEIQTTNLKIGSIRFKGAKMTTKIFFGKKQFVWEITENAPKTPTGMDEESKNSSNKRRFEIRFNDIDKIDINVDNSTLLIETKEKPKEFKEHNPQPKKTTQWVKESSMDGGDDLTDEGKGFYIILAQFSKDTLTKNVQGKLSHLDKIKKCELPLTINGKPYESVPSTPIKTYPMEGHGQGMGHGYPEKEMHYPEMQNQPMPNMSYRGNMMAQGQPQDIIQPGKFLEKTGEEGPPGEEEDDEEKEFPPLTKERKIEAKKFENQLKTMKHEDKIDLIMETIKPKRFGLNSNSKKIYKCPSYKCTVTRHNAQQLKSHLMQKHKKLMDQGFSIDDNGTFTWKPELMDYVLMVAKIYPKFVKNLIREVKYSK